MSVSDIVVGSILFLVLIFLAFINWEEAEKDVWGWFYLTVISAIKVASVFIVFHFAVKYW